MNPLDVIPIPGHPGMYARRVIVDAWQRAGSPPINDAGRLYAAQKARRLAYLNGTGSPADDPDRPDLYELGHVRFVALDIDPTPYRVERLEAAGLIRPFWYEPWHWRVRNVYDYPLVTQLPSTAAGGSTPFPIEEDDMPLYVRATLDMWPINGVHVIKAKYVLAYTPGQPLKVLSSAEWELLEASGAKATNQTAVQLAHLIKSNGLIETYAYEPGGKPSGRIRYTRTDTTYPLVTSARSGV